MKLYLLFFTLLIGSVASAQYNVRDNFNHGIVDTITNSPYNTAAGTKWRNVVSNFDTLGARMIITTNTNPVDTVFSPYSKTGQYAQMFYDSLAVNGSELALMLKKSGTSSFGVSNQAWTYIYGKMTDSVAQSSPLRGVGYRLALQRKPNNAFPDIAVIQRVGITAVTISGVDTIKRPSGFADGDTIKFQCLSGGVFKALVYGKNGVRDSISCIDTTYQPTSWKWWIRVQKQAVTSNDWRLDNVGFSTIIAPGDQAPVIQSLSVTPGILEPTSNIQFTFRITDDKSIDSVYLRVGVFDNGIFGDTLKIKLPVGTKDTTISTVPRPYGIQQWGFYLDVKDSIGNRVNSLPLKTFNVDTAKTHDPTLLVRDTYNRNNTPRVSGSASPLKWVKLKNMPNVNNSATGVIDTSADLQILSNVASPVTNSSVDFFGGVGYDSAFKKIDYPEFAVIIVGKPTIDNRTINMYWMDTTDYRIARGYRLNIFSYTTTNAGLDKITIERVDTSGGYQVFTDLTGAFAINKEIGIGDTIIFKADASSRFKAILASTSSNGGKRDSAVVTDFTFSPTNWRPWIRGVVQSVPWQIDNFMIGLSPQPPAVTRSTIDTVKPTFIGYGGTVTGSTGDTVQIFVRAKDDTTLPNISGGLDSLMARVYKIGVADTLFDSIKVKLPYKTLDTTLFIAKKKYTAAGNYKVIPYVRDSAGNTATGSASQFIIGANTSLWLTAYFPNWMFRKSTSPVWYAVPPMSMDFTGVTHVIQFGNGNVLSAPPYFSPIGADSLEWAYGTVSNGESNRFYYRDSLVTIAHRQGAKVLICIQAAQNGGSLNTITQDSATTDAFCQAVAGYVERHGYDGADVNWETSVGTATQTAMLFRRLRVALNNIRTGWGGKAFITVSPLSGGWSNYNATVSNANVDQINPQEYDVSDAWNASIGANGNWPLNPLHRRPGLPAAFEGNGYDTRGPLQWVAQGFNKSIMGVGMASFGRMYVGSKTITGSHSVSRQDVRNFYTAQQLILQAAGVDTFDTYMNCHYITGTSPINFSFRNCTVGAGQDYFFTYNTPDAQQGVFDWIRLQGFGGGMFYDLQGDVDKDSAYGRTNPVIKAAVAAANNTTPPVINPPLASSTVLPVTNASSQETDLLVFKWRKSANSTGYTIDISTVRTFSTKYITAGTVDTTFTTASGGYPGLQLGTKYYWRVTAFNSGGSSPASNTDSLTTKSPPVPAQAPPVPTLSTPANLAVNQLTTVTLIWVKTNSVDTANFWHAQVATDQNFTASSIIVNDSGIVVPTASRQVAGLQQGTTYYWRVRGGNSSTAKWGSFTAAFSFTTAAAAQGPKIYQFQASYDPITGKYTTRPLSRVERPFVPPSQWVKPDSGYIATYPTGFLTSDSVLVDILALAQGSTMSGSQILAAVNALPIITLSPPINVLSSLATQGGIVVRNGNGISMSDVSNAKSASLAYSLNALGQGKYEITVSGSPMFRVEDVGGVTSLGYLNMLYSGGLKNGITLERTGGTASKWGLQLEQGSQRLLIANSNTNAGIYLSETGVISGATWQANMIDAAYLATNGRTGIGVLQDNNTWVTRMMGANVSGQPLITDSLRLAATGGLTVAQVGKTVTFDASGIVSGTNTKQRILDSLNVGYMPDTLKNRLVMRDSVINFIFGTTAQANLTIQNGSINFKGLLAGGIRLENSISGGYLDVINTGLLAFTPANKHVRIRANGNYAVENDSTFHVTDSAGVRAFSIGSDGTITGNGRSRGNSAFTTTGTTVSVTVPGATTGDTYVVTPTGAAAPVAADAFAINVTATGFTLTRSAAGTSGLTFSWIRMK